ncbi:MAG: polysaccharide deacetylase family protein [Rhizobiaceae bacterium]
MPVEKTPPRIVPRYASAGSKEIWLTFDDGPNPVHTKKVLAVLAAHNAKATFFVIGRHCALYPDTLKRIAADGHRIGNHTYNHPKLTTLSAAKIKEEVLKTEKLIAPFIKGKKLFRPPYGAHNGMVDEVIAELGYRTVIWNVDTVDWNAAFKPDKWVGHGINQIKARQNSVVLNHDIWSTTAGNLDQFLTKIKAIKGAKFQPAATL